MKINHNLNAIVANNKLHQNEDALSASMERLASGLQINHAKDDPSGLAISNRMTTQIDGISQASQNAQDATSLLETADGALNEITSIIQRMSELAIQAANDTNTPTDLQAIQKEIAELKKEIDRMSQDTEFNTKGLLDGNLDGRLYSSKTKTDEYNVYQSDMTRMYVSDYVAAGTYAITVTPGTQASVSTGAATLVTGDSATEITADQAGTVVINGCAVEITEGMTYAEALQAIQETATYAEADMTMDTDTGVITFTSPNFGDDYEVTVSADNANLEALLGMSGSLTSTGTDATVTILNGEQTLTDGTTVTSAFDLDSATYSANGNDITIRQVNGFEISFRLNENLDADTTIAMEVTTMGQLTVQVGANENQTMMVRIPEISCESLYVDDIDVSTVKGADRAIAKLAAALEKVSSVRSKIGAYENRLDKAYASLEVSEENLTNALSRIQDADMAEEMTEYTQYNVLVQASTSVLSQANDLPESVLQLLQ